MGLRAGIRHSTVLTFVTLGAFVWLLVAALSLLGSIDWLTIASADFVGRNAAGGVAGVAVIVVLIGLLVAFYSAIPEEEPAPESWPPSE